MSLVHRVALLAALALAQGRGRSRRSLARGGTTAGPSTVEECVPTDENEGDDGSGGEQCQDWCTDEANTGESTPGLFCDWCLCKACDVCTNLASPSPPPATVDAGDACVPTAENKAKGDGSEEQCQDWCTDPSKHDTDFLTAQPRFFCDWCYCKACDVCAPTAAPATTVPASTVAAAACVPTQTGDDGSGGEQCQDWCTDPSNTGENSPGLFCDWCLCKACDVCESPPPPAAAADNKCAAIKRKKACKKTGCSWKGPKRAKKCIAKVCKDKSKNCDPSKVTNCAKSAKKLTVHKRGRQCLLSCIKYYPNLKLKKKDQCVMP